MQTILKISAAAMIAVVFAACGGGAKQEKGALGDKKVELEKLKKEQKDVNDKIAKLEAEIEKLDPNASAGKAKLVTITPINTDTFNHFIDLQGKVDAQNVAYVAPRGGGGTVRAIYVKQGQSVRKGQMILKLDDALQRQGVVAAQQQISGIKARLAQAQTVYERYQNLWKQNIGAEINVINAKADVEALQSQLKAAQAQVGLAQEQVNLTNVTAEISGVIEKMDARVGQAFTGSPQGGITIVNNSDLKITAQVPENYLDKVKVGNVVEVMLPESNNQTFSAKITVAGKLIDPVSRSFYIEAKIPANNNLRPNQLAQVRIKDYAAPNAITIPVNTLQSDEKGKYVMVAVTEAGKKIARKRQVVIGELYGEQLEVKSGLQAGDSIITDGFQNLYEGQLITTGTN